MELLMTHLRLRLKSLLAGFMVRIVNGPLKGYRFGVFTGTRFIRGTYHPEETSLLIGLCRHGYHVLDIGAHVGYYTLLMSKQVGPEGKVFAFEPFSVNQALLKRHIQANGCSNIQVFGEALGISTGEMPFDAGQGSGRGKLVAKNSPPSIAAFPKVPVTRLDDLFDSGRIVHADLVKIDIEGGEVDCLRGGVNFLSHCKPTIFLATHGALIKDECIEILTGIGYDIQAAKNSSLIAMPKNTKVCHRSRADQSAACDRVHFDMSSVTA